MEMTVKVPAEVEAQAKARGLRVEAYVEELLSKQVNPSGSQRQREPQEIRAWLDQDRD